MGEKFERKRTWKGGKNLLPFYIISTVVLFIFGIVFVGSYFEWGHLRENIDFSETVEATITDAYDYYDPNLHYVTHYFLRYEYTSPEGVYYWNTFGNFKDKEEAMSHIGEKVQIYIDGDVHSTPYIVYSNKPNIWFLIIGIMLLLCGLADFIIFVIPHKWK